jgi:predicted hydrocarbon binding protein
MADTFNDFSDQRVQVQKNEDYFSYVIERCPVCWDRSSPTPCCYAATGLLQETVSWVGEGRSFEVQEVTCVAAGAANCTFRIGRRPLD